MKEIIVSITGASGIIYAIKLLEVLKSSKIKTHLIISKNSDKIMELEAPITKVEIQDLASENHDQSDFTSPLASGSFICSKDIAMIIIPCSMKTLAAIAHGYANNLITRAADVILKEKKPLIIVPRETPFNTIHLKNMWSLSQAGAIISPPVPAFYMLPKTIDDLISDFIGRILTSLGIPNELHQPWLG